MRESYQIGETKYTLSAVVDRISEYIKGHEDYRKIVYSFNANPRGTFLFNPLENETMNEFFLQSPEEFPLLVKKAILIQMNDSVAQTIAERSIVVQITESRQIKMRDWYAEHEGIPLAVECQIVGSDVDETYTKSARAYCWKCGFELTIGELQKIPNCGNSRCDRHEKPLEIDRLSIKSGNTKVVMIQEPMDEAQHGNSRILPCIIRDDDVKTTFVGQHKRIIGVLRSYFQEKKNTNKIMIHAVAVQDIESNKMKMPTDDEIVYFEKLVKNGDYLDLLTKSFAPEIYGEDLAKLCVILARVGGTKVDRLRGELHCFLIGNPGTGKSKILEFLLEVTNNCGFAVGGTMTGSGITIAMDTLPNRQKFPRVGIVGRCHGSCVAIDELNQTSDEDKGKLFECMESGKMHYNKGGFDTVAKAETTIIAAANPKHYTYDPEMTISDNVNLPSPLTDRFDLKVNMTDEKPELEEQKKLDHISLLRQIGIEEYIEKNNLLKTKDLYLLLNYAKSIKPTMTPKASKLMKEFYMMMKNIDKDQRMGSFKINTRFYEAIIRVSTAYAKLMLSKTITEEHAMLAIEIIKSTLRTFNMKTNSNEITMPLMNTDDSAEGAFIKTWRNQEGVWQSEWIAEKQFLEALVAEYGPKFKVFNTMEKASKYFDNFYNKGKITKSAGLYKLL